MTSPLRRLVSQIPLRMSEVRTLAPVRARNLGVSLAGRARVLYELATGDDAANDGGGSPVNPQGRLGTDLSGPPFGPCLRTPLIVAHGQGTQAAMAGERTLHTFGGEDEWFFFPMRIWVRPHVRSLGLEPLTRGYLALAYLRASGASSATADVDFANLTAEGGAIYRRPTLTSISSSSSSAAVLDTMYVPLVPGINFCQLSVRSTSSASVLSILRCSVNQVALLEH